MRIRVVTVVDRAGAAGGGERVAIDLATQLRRERFESVLCVTRPCSRSAVDAIRATGTSVIELNRTSRLSLLPWLRLVQLLRRSHVQVLHSHKFGSNAWSAIVARLAGIPVFVAHEHSWAFTGDRLRSAVNRHVIATRAAAILTVSAHDRRRLIELEHLDPNRVVVCPNGVPELLLDAVDGNQLRRELNLPDDAAVIGLVGGLRPEKRVDLLVRAAARLREHFPDLLTVIVGDGPEAGHLARLAARLGIGDAVRFTGRREDATALIHVFDVAVLTSDREGSPLALLEYMAAARPIVATRVGGVPDIIRHGLDGLLVPPDDPAALARAIEELLLDRARGTAMGLRASERQAREFRLDSAVKRIEALYEQLLPA
jgi:glycosyltransferase involved in cell wall biosynthesis